MRAPHGAGHWPNTSDRNRYRFPSAPQSVID